MRLACLGISRFAASLVLNDIGPVVGAKGLERIKSYVGKVKPARTWEEAADQAAEINGAAFPHYTPKDWDRWAHRTYAENAAGELELLYDPAIAEPGVIPWLREFLKTL